MAVTITKHLEHVAQLEAQLYGSPYFDVAERTVALAKRALETEFVCLDAAEATEAATETAAETEKHVDVSHQKHSSGC